MKNALSLLVVLLLATGCATYMSNGTSLEGGTGTPLVSSPQTKSGLRAGVNYAASLHTETPDEQRDGSVHRFLATATYGFPDKSILSGLELAAVAPTEWWMHEEDMEEVAFGNLRVAGKYGFSVNENFSWAVRLATDIPTGNEDKEITSLFGTPGEFMAIDLTLPLEYLAFSKKLKVLLDPGYTYVSGSVDHQHVFGAGLAAEVQLFHWLSGALETKYFSPRGDFEDYLIVGGSARISTVRWFDVQVGLYKGFTSGAPNGLATAMINLNIWEFFKKGELEVSADIEVVNDSDGDGIPDKDDMCNNPGCAEVDLEGCPTDIDGDKVRDCDDICPDTPTGVTVDGTGCPKDSDGDGVFDGVDQCPDTPAGTKVNEVGCALVDTEASRAMTLPDGTCNEFAGLLDWRTVCVQINFDFNQSVLKATEKPKLVPFLDLLGTHPDLRVRIEGHTDSSGSDEYNQTLSEERAEAVKDYLVAEGIASDRFDAVGYGKAHPIASNETIAGRAQNRRTQFVRIK